MPYRGRPYIVTQSTGGRSYSDPYASSRHAMPDPRRGVRRSTERIPDHAARVEPYERSHDIAPAHARSDDLKLRGLVGYGRHTKRGGIALMALLLVVVVIGVIATPEIVRIVHNAQQPIRFAPKVPSTPADQWRQGETPLLYQTDPLWANEPYGAGTLGSNGSAPLCLSMVRINVIGDVAFGPAACASFARERGYDSAADATALLTEGAAELGMEAMPTELSERELRRQIIAGRPVICALTSGATASVGSAPSYVVAKSIDPAGMVVVYDPASAARSEEPWPFLDLLSRSTALWAYESLE